MFRLVCVCLVCIISSPPACCGWQETVAYIDNLLKQGKKVAFLVIDMQEQYAQKFLPYEKYQVSSEINEVLLTYMGDDRVFLVDVNRAGRGATLQEIQAFLTRGTGYSLYLKTTEGAFHSESLPDVDAIPGAIRGEMGSFLRENNVDVVIPSGCFYSGCVKKTASGALDEGFEVAFDPSLNVLFSTQYTPYFSPEKYSENAAKLWTQLMEKYPDRLTMIKTNYGEKSGACTSPQKKVMNELLTPPAPSPTPSRSSFISGVNRKNHKDSLHGFRE